MKWSSLVAQILCVLINAATPGLGVPPETFPASADNLHEIEIKVQQEVNQARMIAHVPQLHWDERLATEARRHAKNMASRNFFSHHDPASGDVNNRLDKSGIEWMRCAENLFSERGFHDPAKRAVQTWLDSPGHRKNMLDSRMSDAGVGAAFTSDGTLLIVQVYILK